MALPLLAGRENQFLQVNRDGSNTDARLINRVFSASRSSTPLDERHAYAVVYYNGSTVGEIVAPQKEQVFLGYSFTVVNTSLQNVIVRFPGATLIGHDRPEQLLAPGQYALFVAGGSTTIGNDEWLVLPGQDIQDTGGGGTVDPDRISIATHFLELDKFITLQQLRQYAQRRDVRGINMMPDPEPVTGWELNGAVIQPFADRGPDNMAGILRVTSDGQTIDIRYPIDKQFIEGGQDYLFEAWLRVEQPLLLQAGMGIVIDGDFDNATSQDALLELGESQWVKGRHFFRIPQLMIDSATDIALNIQLISAVPFTGTGSGADNTLFLARIASYDVNDVIPSRLNETDKRQIAGPQTSVRVFSRDDVRDMIIYMVERYSQRRPNVSLNAIPDPHYLNNWQFENITDPQKISDEEKPRAQFGASWLQTFMECRSDGPIELRRVIDPSIIPGGTYRFSALFASTQPGLVLTVTTTVGDDRTTYQANAGDFASNTYLPFVSGDITVGDTGLTLLITGEMQAGEKLIMLWPDLVPIVEAAGSGGNGGGGNVDLPDLVNLDEKRMLPNTGGTIRGFRPVDVRDMIAYGNQAYAFPRDNLNLQLFTDTTFWAGWTVSFGRMWYVDAPEQGPFQSTWVQSRLEGNGDSFTVATLRRRIEPDFMESGGYQITMFVAGNGTLVDGSAEPKAELEIRVEGDDINLPLAIGEVNLGKIREGDWKELSVRFDRPNRPFEIVIASRCRTDREFMYIVAPRIDRLVPTITEEEKVAGGQGAVVRQWTPDDIRDLINIAIMRFAQPVADVSTVVFDDPILFATWNRNDPDDPNRPMTGDPDDIEGFVIARILQQGFSTSPVPGPFASSYNRVWFASSDGNFAITRTVTRDAFGHTIRTPTISLYILLEEEPPPGSRVVFALSTAFDYVANRENVVSADLTRRDWQRLEINALVLGNADTHFRIMGKIGPNQRFRIANTFIDGEE